jgi:Sushi repeat (SCR repeat)
VPGINCSSLTVDNGDLNTTDISFETYVNVTCQPGFQFSYNQKWIVTQCQLNGTWLPQPANCTREHLGHFFSQHFRSFRSWQFSCSVLKKSKSIYGNFSCSRGDITTNNRIAYESLWLLDTLQAFDDGVLPHRWRIRTDVWHSNSPHCEYYGLSIKQFAWMFTIKLVFYKNSD